MNIRLWLCSVLGVVGLAACAPRPVDVPGAAPARAAAAAPDVVRFVAGSCNDQDLSQAFWPTVDALGGEAFLALGDNIYADVVLGQREDGSLKVSFVEDIERVKAAYAALSANPYWQDFATDRVFYPTWDDHDYGLNDAGAELSIREASQQAFLEFWEVPSDDVRWSRDGVYSSVMTGSPGRRVQVVLLDTRSFRTALRKTDAYNAPGKERYVPTDEPGSTMLGADQWAWLEQVLRQPAEVRLIVSSVQVLPVGHGFERWLNMPSEQARLMALLDETSGERILVSGDRHFGAIYRSEDGRRPVVELSTSSLNRSFGGGDETAPLRVGPWVSEVNAGTIDIDWRSRTVTLQLVRLDEGHEGEVAHAVTWAMDVASGGGENGGQ
ncbi:MAG: alkaline phosphatase D family protein [Myxococcota bacterium]